MEFQRPDRERPVTLILPAVILLVIIALGLFFFLGKESSEEANGKTTTVAIPVSSPSAPGELPEFTGFTEWMTPPELDAHIRLLNAGHKESFWDRGHWIIAAEGRWENGTHEFRIAYDKSPPEGEFNWKYKINQTQEAYTKALDQNALEGYTLISSQSFIRPDDTKRYQGVWHQVSAAALPSSEGSYEEESSARQEPESEPEPEPEKKKDDEPPLSGLNNLDIRDAGRN